MVRTEYAGWTAGATIKDARLKESCSIVRLQLEPNWSDIGGGWKLRPESRPEVCSYSLFIGGVVSNEIHRETCVRQALYY